MENAAIENINKARDVSQIGYVPYYGPDVAAFSPMQQQSMQSTGNAASAFGLAPQGFNAMAGMPQAQKPLQAAYRAILVRLCMSSH